MNSNALTSKYRQTSNKTQKLSNALICPAINSKKQRGHMAKEKSGDLAESQGDVED